MKFYILITVLFCVFSIENAELYAMNDENKMGRTTTDEKPKKSISLDLKTLGQEYAQTKEDAVNLSPEERKKSGLLTEKDFADYVIQQLDVSKAEDQKFSPISDLENLPVRPENIPDIIGQQIEQEFGTGTQGFLNYVWHNSLIYQITQAAYNRYLSAKIGAANKYAKTLDRKKRWELATAGFNEPTYQYKFLAVETRYPNDPGHLFLLREELIQQRLLQQYTSRLSKAASMEKSFISTLLSLDSLFVMLFIGVFASKAKTIFTRMIISIAISAGIMAGLNNISQFLNYPEVPSKQTIDVIIFGAALGMVVGIVVGIWLKMNKISAANNSLYLNSNKPQIVDSPKFFSSDLGIQAENKDMSFQPQSPSVLQITPVQGTDIFTKIEKLAELQRKGLISELEFTTKKIELLNKL